MKRNRPHFSWSQMSLWHASKRAFWKQYNQNVPSKSNVFFNKGHELAEYMETKKIPVNCKDPMLVHVAEQVPQLEIPEQRLEYLYKGKIPLLGFTDTGAFDFSEFIEYKTGKIADKPAWTQEKVDEHDQLLFYAYMYLKLTGNVPKCRLVWIETMDTPDGLRYTGEVYVFHRKFTKVEINKFGVKIGKTIKEIDDYVYEEHEVSEVVVKRYMKLTKQQEEIAKELTLIKMEVHQQLTKAGVTFGKGLGGNFILTGRKTWKYSEAMTKLSDKVTESNKEATKLVTKARAQEVKDEIATCTTKETISFKFNKVKSK